jgi:hypothetical protein
MLCNYVLDAINFKNAYLLANILINFLLDCVLIELSNILISILLILSSNGRSLLLLSSNGRSLLFN